MAKKKRERETKDFPYKKIIHSLKALNVPLKAYLCEHEKLRPTCFWRQNKQQQFLSYMYVTGWN